MVGLEACGGSPRAAIDAASSADAVGPGEAEAAVEPPMPVPMIVITSPRGPATATELTAVTISGALGGQVTWLGYRVERTGQSPLEGTILPASKWTSPTLALAPGDNHVTVVARTAGGAEAQDTLTITCNPGLRLDAPSAMPAELLVGQPGQITVTLLIRDRAAVLPETVELVGVDAAGRPQGSALATLADDGVTPDTLKRDALFSGAWTVDTSQAREQRLRVRLRYEDEDGEEQVGLSPLFTVRVVRRISRLDVESFEAAGETAHASYAAARDQGATTATALDAVVAALKQAPGVADVGVDPTGYSVSWTMDWGMEGVFSDAPEGFRGGAAPARRSSVTLAPFATEFGAASEVPRVQEALGLCRCPTLSPMDLHLDLEATLARFRTMHERGVIAISSHGSINRQGRTLILLQEPIDWTVRDDPTSLVAQDAAARRIGGDYDYKRPKVNGRHPATFVIFPEFVSHYNRPMPQDSVVFLGTCYGAYRPEFAQAFLGNGAGAFFAFNGSVSHAWAKAVGIELFEQLRQGRTAQKAAAQVRAKLGWQDPAPPHPWFVLLPSASSSVITEDACDGTMSIVDVARYQEGTSSGAPQVSGTVSYQSIDRLRPSPFSPHAFIMQRAFKSCSGYVEKRNLSTGELVGWESSSGQLRDLYPDPTETTFNPDQRLAVTKLTIDPVAKTAQIAIVPEEARTSEDDWVDLMSWNTALGASFDVGLCPFAGGLDGLAGWNNLSDTVTFGPDELELSAQRIKGHKVVQNAKGNATIDFDYALSP